MDYSLQSNRKTHEGKDHPDRDAQFEYIATTVAPFQQKQCPVISIDTKKKELVGNFHHRGQEWEPQGEPRRSKGAAPDRFYSMPSRLGPKPYLPDVRS